MMQKLNYCELFNREDGSRFFGRERSSSTHLQCLKCCWFLCHMEDLESGQLEMGTVCYEG